MTCSRCLRLMVEDQLLDLESPYGQMWATSLRCANCGHVHDSASEQHRLVQQEKPLALPRGVPDDQDDEVHLGAESFIRRVV
jgi:hypothetical protein